ncbi:MAG: hypothetical protein ACE5PO_01765 [Candidatus Bathyarchaeia archaeon]
MEKPSSSLQVALSAMVATIVMGGIVVSAFFAQVPNSPPEIAAVLAASAMLLGLMFLPLMWWRNRAGYIGAIGVGIFTLIQGVIGLAGNIPASNPVVAVEIVALVISVVLIVSSAAAWREKT